MANRRWTAPQISAPQRVQAPGRRRTEPADALTQALIKMPLNVRKVMAAAVSVERTAQEGQQRKAVDLLDAKVCFMLLPGRLLNPTANFICIGSDWEMLRSWQRAYCLRTAQDAMIQGLEQSLAEMAEQNMQLQAALSRFLAWQGPPVRMIADAATQVHLSVFWWKLPVRANLAHGNPLLGSSLSNWQRVRA